MGVTGSRENKEKKPVVLIVGGGYGGIECAKLLDKTGRFFVILIDRKSYFLHNVAALRASVEENFAPQILIPYNRLLTNGCFIQAEVTSILTDSVQIHGYEDRIHFNYLVIATGSSYAFPGKIPETKVDKANELYQDLRMKIERSQQILIIGGGPVGVELAAEIITDFPQKTITIVHNRPMLLQPNIFNEQLYLRLHEQMQKMGIRLILDDRVELTNDQINHRLFYIEEKRNYTTIRSKESITADLTFFCTGARLNNKSLLNGPLKSQINPQTGRIRVNNYLQVEGFENIFAIGDISDKEDKYAFLAGDQAKYVAKLIPLIESKSSYPKEYKIHSNPAILLTLGRNGGIGQLPTKGGTLIGNFLVKMFKSKSMFLDKYRSTLNFKPNETSSDSTSQFYSMKSVLELNDEQLEKFLAGLPVKNLEPGQDFL